MFLEVARQGSVHAAARRLKLDHSTVCRRIGRLESLLAVKLFDRSRRGIAVRTEAHGLLKHIEQMDRHAGSLEDAIARGGTDASQVVRVATMEGIASGYLARCLPALEQFGKNLKTRARQHPASGRPEPQGSRYFPELLQSGRARLEKRVVR